MSNTELRSFITVSDMARAVGLSRSRFYSLIGTVFPAPVKSEHSTRSFYDEEGQRRCLSIRKNNVGIDGKPILFQTKSVPSGAKRSSKPKFSKYASLIESLVALGLSGISEKEVEQTIKACFPSGICGVCEDEVLRTTFVELSSRQPG